MDDDWEYMMDRYCPRCSEPLEQTDCAYCGGEGGRGYEDLQFEDPLWYDEDDFIVCDTCLGRGYHIKCSNDECKVTQKEIYNIKHNRRTARTVIRPG